jgi:hypothetical protein
VPSFLNTFSERIDPFCPILPLAQSIRLCKNRVLAFATLHQHCDGIGHLLCSSQQLLLLPLMMLLMMMLQPPPPARRQNV